MHLSGRLSLYSIVILLALALPSTSQHRLLLQDIDDTSSDASLGRGSDSAEPTGCQESGYCSLKHVTSFMGDVYPSAGLKASLQVSSFWISYNGAPMFYSEWCCCAEVLSRAPQCTDKQMIAFAIVSCHDRWDNLWNRL